MDHRPNIPGSQPQLPHGSHPTATGSSTSRRRSHSQPVAPVILPHLAHPYPASNRPTDQFDFEAFLHQVPNALEGHDEDLFAQLSAMSDEQQRHLPTAPSSSAFQSPQHMPILQEHVQQQLQQQGAQQGGPNPLLTQTFLAWLQYMHLQNQLSQSSPQGSQQQQAHPQQAHQQQLSFQAYVASMPQAHGYTQTLSLDTAGPQAGPSQPRQRRASIAHPAAESPASEAGDMEGEQTAVVEDKRRRNTAASARFRVKKKQWTLNLERSITDLSGRVEELEREAAELRRENGWLKEIVMLKSKRFGSAGATPDQPSPPPSEERGDEVDKDGNSDSRNPDAAGKGKGRDVS